MRGQGNGLEDGALAELGRRYETTLRAWSRASVLDDVEEANRLFDELRVCLKVLRDDERGRGMIERLMEDHDAGVRLMAASEALLWNATTARPVLGELAVGQSVAWQHSFTAEMTLREFDAGRLKFDW